MIIKVFIKKYLIKQLNKIFIKRNKSLSDEIDHNDLIYCFKNNTPTKYFNDFENYIKIFRKKKSCEMKLEDAK